MTCLYQFCLAIFQLARESSKTDFMHVKMTQFLLQCVSGSTIDCIIGCLHYNHHQLEFIVSSLFLYDFIPGCYGL